MAGILVRYSTIHLPPARLDRVLTDFRRLLASSGMLVLGFFDSDDDLAEFDQKVITAYRWPVDVFAEDLAKAGFPAVQRLRQQFAERPDRKYAAIAARKLRRQVHIQTTISSIGSGHIASASANIWVAVYTTRW